MKWSSGGNLLSAKISLVITQWKQQGVCWDTLAVFGIENMQTFLYPKCEINLLGVFPIPLVILSQNCAPTKNPIIEIATKNVPWNSPNALFGFNAGICTSISRRSSSFRLRSASNFRCSTIFLHSSSRITLLDLQMPSDGIQVYLSLHWQISWKVWQNELFVAASHCSLYRQGSPSLTEIEITMVRSYLRGGFQTTIPPTKHPFFGIKNSPSLHSSRVNSQVKLPSLVSTQS